MKVVITILSGIASIIAVSKWGIVGLFIVAVLLGVIIYAAWQGYKWWEHRRFIKWCARQIWNVTVVSEYPNDPNVLSEAKRIAAGLIESGNPLKVKVHAVVHRDNSIKTFFEQSGQVSERLKKVTEKMFPDMPMPPVEDFEKDYPQRVKLFKKTDKVDRDWELANMVDAGEISRQFYEKNVLNQNV